MGVSVARYQVKEVAASRGFTLKRLADEADLSESRVRAIANNRVPDVTVGTLERIAATLAAPFGSLFEKASLDEVPVIVEPTTAQRRRTASKKVVP